MCLVIKIIFLSIASEIFFKVIIIIVSNFIINTKAYQNILRKFLSNSCQILLLASQDNSWPILLLASQEKIVRMNLHIEKVHMKKSQKCWLRKS